VDHGSRSYRTTANANIAKKIGYVQRTGTLADAKAAMEAVPGAQDVFVTDTGDHTGRVVGWLTDVDISQNIELKTSPGQGQ